MHRKHASNRAHILRQVCSDHFPHKEKTASHQDAKSESSRLVEFPHFPNNKPGFWQDVEAGLWDLAWVCCQEGINHMKTAQSSREVTSLGIYQNTLPEPSFKSLDKSQNLSLKVRTNSSTIFLNVNLHKESLIWFVFKANSAKIFISSLVRQDI